jgi:hypothetical protein
MTSLYELVIQIIALMYINEASVFYDIYGRYMTNIKNYEKYDETMTKIGRFFDFLKVFETERV